MGLQTPDIVVLIETKNQSNRYGYLKRQLSMKFIHVVEPLGLSGKLYMFWKKMPQVFFFFFFITKICRFLLKVVIQDAEN